MDDDADAGDGKGPATVLLLPSSSRHRHLTRSSTGSMPAAASPSVIPSSTSASSSFNNSAHVTNKSPKPLSRSLGRRRRNTTRVTAVVVPVKSTNRQPSGGRRKTAILTPRIRIKPLRPPPGHPDYREPAVSLVTGSVGKPGRRKVRSRKQSPSPPPSNSKSSNCSSSSSSSSACASSRPPFPPSSKPKQTSPVNISSLDPGLHEPNQSREQRLTRIQKFLKTMTNDSVRVDYIRSVDEHVNKSLESVKSKTDNRSGKRGNRNKSQQCQITESKEKIDIMSPDSILSHITNPRLLFNPATFSSLPLYYQYKLVKYLPACDQLVTDQGWVKPSASSLANEFFSKACLSWFENLKDGHFTTEYLQRKKQDIEREKGKVDPWKVKHFEPIWGLKQKSQQMNLSEFDRIPRIVLPDTSSPRPSTQLNSPPDGKNRSPQTNGYALKSNCIHPLPSIRRKAAICKPGRYKNLRLLSNHMDKQPESKPVPCAVPQAVSVCTVKELIDLPKKVANSEDHVSDLKVESPASSACSCDLKSLIQCSACLALCHSNCVASSGLCIRCSVRVVDSNRTNETVPYKLPDGITITPIAENMQSNQVPVITRADLVPSAATRIGSRRILPANFTISSDAVNEEVLKELSRIPPQITVIPLGPKTCDLSLS